MAAEATARRVTFSRSTVRSGHSNSACQSAGVTAVAVDNRFTPFFLCCQEDAALAGFGVHAPGNISLAIHLKLARARKSLSVRWIRRDRVALGSYQTVANRRDRKRLRAVRQPAGLILRGQVHMTGIL